MSHGKQVLLSSDRVRGADLRLLPANAARFPLYPGTSPYRMSRRPFFSFCTSRIAPNCALGIYFFLLLFIRQIIVDHIETLFFCCASLGLHLDIGCFFFYQGTWHVFSISGQTVAGRFGKAISARTRRDQGDWYFHTRRDPNVINFCWLHLPRNSILYIYIYIMYFSINYRIKVLSRFQCTYELTSHFGRKPRKDPRGLKYEIRSIHI